jgi:hypothetical protein
VDKNVAYPKAIAELKAMGVLPESVELTSWSSISTTSSNKIIGSSNGWSSQDWASSRLKRHGEHWGIRSDAYEEEGANAGRGARRHQVSGDIHRHLVWSGRLS